MSNAPSAKHLLGAATALIRETAAALDAHARYQLLLCARAAEIALRDSAVAPAIEHAEGHLEGLASAATIRKGACDGEALVHEALMALTAAAVYPTRPDLLNAREKIMLGLSP